MKFLYFLVVVPFISLGQLQITKVRDGVYVHTSFKDVGGKPFPSNGLLVETFHAVFIVDTPWTEDQTKELVRWVKKNLRKPVTHAIVTHSHDDRITGVPILKKRNTRIVAGELTAQKMQELKYAKPDIIVPTDSLFKIDGLAVETYFPGAGHTADNIVVWLPTQRILFGGCFIKSAEAPGLGNIADADLRRWPVSLMNVKQKFLNPDVVVPGHQSWMNSASIDYTLKLLEEKESKGN